MCQLMKITQRFLLVLLLAGLTACGGLTIQGVDLSRVATAIKHTSNLKMKTQDQEIIIGKNTASVLLSKAALANDDDLQAYVNKVGYWLARQSSRPSLPWRFVVLDNNAINAFAAPGGYVFITTGMLGSLNNEAELAGVLAHEIGHVVRKHHLIALQSQAQKGLAADLLTLASQSTGNSSNTTLPVDFDKAVLNLYGRGLERGDELAADEYGLELASKSGYDPYAFISVLQSIDSRATSTKSSLERFTKTHPDAQTRLVSVEPVLEELDELPLNTQTLAQRFLANTRY